MTLKENQLQLAEVVAEDESTLAKLGYRQVLSRQWRAFTTLAICISSMSVLDSVVASFGIGLSYGGPVVCIYGWIAVSLLVLTEGLGMAELASSMPTTGGMYYWMFELAGPTWGPFACWVTGWLNLLGQLASIASTQSLMANIIASVIFFASGGNEGEGTELSKEQILGVYTGCLFISGLINSVPEKWVAKWTDLGAYAHFIGAALFTLMVPAIATYHQPSDWVFTSFESAPAEEVGITDKTYVFVLGLLLPAYAYIGLDGPAHMAEESVGAARSAPAGILGGIAYMFIAGLALIISFLFSISSYEDVLSFGSNAVPKLLYDAFEQRYGSGTGGIAMLSIAIIGAFFCTASTVTFVSRILFAYSRDRAVPGHSLWIKIEPRTQQPLCAVWGTCLGVFILGLPMLGDEVAFTAILSLATVALNIVYVTPILVRCTVGRKRFRPGPFHLGRWTYLNGAIATCYMVFSTVVFCLPTAYPVDKDTLNYASIALCATVCLSLAWWFFPLWGARHWFKGPVRTIDEDSAHGTAGYDGPVKL